MFIRIRVNDKGVYQGENMFLWQLHSHFVVQKSTNVTAFAIIHSATKFRENLTRGYQPIVNLSAPIIVIIITIINMT